MTDEYPRRDRLPNRRMKISETGEGIRAVHERIGEAAE